MVDVYGRILFGFIYLCLINFNERNCSMLCAGLRKPVESGKLMTQGRMESDPVPTLRGGLRSWGCVSVITVECEGTGASVGMRGEEDGLSIIF